MTPADRAAEDARQAIVAALLQLSEQVLTPLSRIDHDARQGYYALHTQTAKIVQRLGSEVARGLGQLDAQHGAVTASIASFEQQRLNDLAAPLVGVQQRLGADILRGIKTLGR